MPAHPASPRWRSCRASADARPATTLRLDQNGHSGTPEGSFFRRRYWRQNGGSRMSRIAVRDRPSEGQLRPAAVTAGRSFPSAYVTTGAPATYAATMYVACRSRLPRARSGTHRGTRIGMRGGLLDVAQGDPSVQTRGDGCMLSVCGVTALPIPARRAILRTIRPAPCLSSRRPSPARKTGPPVRSPMARSIARAVRGASGMVTTLPPLRVIVRVRCPRSRPRCSMSAPVASETRSPFSASSEISACSTGGPSPAATSSAPSSLRSRATAWDS